MDECMDKNMITGPVQIWWHKFARYWDIELRESPMDQNRLRMTPIVKTFRSSGFSCGTASVATWVPYWWTT